MFNVLFMFLDRFTITDDTANSNFLIDANAKVCLEANSPCIMDLPLAQNLVVPKPLCNLDKGFQISGTEC